ncbi:MAG: LysM peptidoglycan-binding domain-containing protein, partial [Leptonema sp. (in: Bacteria)]|nr:LysM peptidoglycan-binding domain-containing protein [Leptonema sp. (in: bacteria)]
SASTVESMLGQAKEFGIEKYDEPGYRNTAALVAAIHEDLDADKLKSANEKIVGAETQASALLETAKKGKAQDLHAEAEAAVKAAQADFDKATSKLSAADKVKYGEYLKAAGEAQASSQDRLNDGMYEESIAESREVIRLSMMVREGSSLSARDLAKLEEERKLRESNLTDNGSTTDKVNNQKSDESTATTEAATKESYKVQKTKPAESLWRISAKKYGKGKHWTKIYDANRDKIKDPNKIYPCQEFVIPVK